MSRFQFGIVWNTDNMPTQIVSGSTTEQYYYGGDGGRVKRVSGTTTTFYIGGVYEEDSPSGTKRTLYAVNGATVAQTLRRLACFTWSPQRTPGLSNLPRRIWSNTLL